MQRYKNEKELFNQNPIASQKEIIHEICFCFLVAKRNTDKEQAAWLIYKLNPKYKEYINKWCIDLDDKYEKLVSNRIKKRNEMNRLSQKRRHQKHEDFSLTNEQWEETCESFNYCCAYCRGEEKLTYDHFIPFSKGGSFGKDNIVPCCTTCNSSKNNKDFITWYPKQIFYDMEQEQKILNFFKYA
ncbi:HNH endonuclease signature motif containing protein [Lysinibacillus sp. M3]|uniref:HNH endonuclease signature motif containing protein n=1 Tax=Lysinibacillus zambalensis TaxID=3160866 RepID=A0ABV1MZF0_9BACI